MMTLHRWKEYFLLSSNEIYWGTSPTMAILLHNLDGPANVHAEAGPQRVVLLVMLMVTNCDRACRIGYQ